jgi:photosystem II stability/assembly factor-like uncharacterized protein
VSAEREEAVMRELLMAAIEPPSPGLTDRVLAAVADWPRERREQGPHWALSLVAVALAAILVATLALAVRMGHREGVPATHGSPPAEGATPVGGTGARAFPTAAGAWLAQHTAGGTTTLFQTADGGQTWTLRLSYPGELPGQVLVDASGAGVVVAGRRDASPPIVFRTADRGTTWQRVVLPAVAGAWGALAFVDPSNGWVLVSLGPGRAEMLSTDDGGRTWTASPEFNDRANFPGIASTGLRILWASGGRAMVVPPPAGTVPVHVFVTDDGGASWRSSFPASPGGNLTSANARLDGRLLPDGRAVLFMEAVDVRGQGTDLFVAVSADAGRTWSKPVRLDGAAGDRALFALDQDHWWAGSGDGLVATEDGGRTVRRHDGALPAGWSFQSIGFSSASEGWAVATAGGRAAVFATHDGGAHWDPIRPPG